MSSGFGISDLGSSTPQSPTRLVVLAWKNPRVQKGKAGPLIVVMV